MSILEKYLAKTVISGTLMVLLVLVALGAFFNFLGEMGRIGTADYGMTDALVFVSLSTPQLAWEMFPVAALIGSLLALGALASGSELIAMRASGISLLHLARAAAAGALLLAVVTLLLGDFIAPPAEQYAQSRRAVALHGELSIAGRQGVWARDGGAFVNVRQLSSEQRVDGIFIYEFSEDGQLERAIQAAAARFQPPGSWALERVEETEFLRDGRTRTTAWLTRDWDTQLSPDLLNLFVVDPGSLSAFGLSRYVGYLKRSGLDSRRYQHAFWSKLVAPFSVIVMVVLAVPFVSGSQRSAGAGQRLLVGMLIGVGFYMVNRVLGFSGEVFNLNAVFVAWLPTLALGAAALFALARMR
ncbi:MAG: LPS export ABC transporter permease LptG [Xanthomonadaceae bacterium]|nr:LPS export ABC transporter permease LptG [Xanthomonadaceae bacterium]